MFVNATDWLMWTKLTTRLAGNHISRGLLHDSAHSTMSALFAVLMLAFPHRVKWRKPSARQHKMAVKLDVVKVCVVTHWKNGKLFGNVWRHVGPI